MAVQTNAINAAILLLRSYPIKFEADVKAGIIDINMRDNRGNGILHIIHKDIDKEDLALLICLGINLDMMNNANRTWLFDKWWETVNKFYDLIEESKDISNDLFGKIKFNPNSLNKDDHILCKWTVKKCVRRFYRNAHVFSEPLDAKNIPDEWLNLYHEIMCISILLPGGSKISLERDTFENIKEVKELRSIIDISFNAFKEKEKELAELSYNALKDKTTINKLKSLLSL